MFIAIDRNSHISIKKQLYDGVVTLILEGELTEGDKLPSSRVLADQLSIARNTVIEIYDQLAAEGYCRSEKGRGTFISEAVKDLHVQNKVLKTVTGMRVKDSREETKSISPISLYSGTPDLERFPVKHWLRYMKDYFYGPETKLVGFTGLKGYLPLRKALEAYLRMHKGIACSTDNIFITNGTSGALNKIAMTLMHECGTLITECYGMDFVPDIFGCYGYEINTVPVDVKGMVTDCLPDQFENQVIYTTPSHQMPLGGILPIDRRQKLIEYAKNHHHIIIEDDYDSEFRYVGAQVNAIKQLDTETVIYLGTFSKTIGPGLRIGYMVVPDKLINTFDEIFETSFSQVQVMDQYCLSRLLEEGQYEKIILKMNRLYKKKSDRFIAGIKECFKDEAEILGSGSGMHFLLKFRKRAFSIQDKKLFEKVGLQVDYLEDYAVDAADKETTDTVIVGFGHLSLDEIDEAVRRLNKLKNDL